jgi:hypothetical protein
MLAGVARSPERWEPVSVPILIMIVVNDDDHIG